MDSSWCREVATLESQFEFITSSSSSSTADYTNMDQDGDMLMHQRRSSSAAAAAGVVVAVEETDGILLDNDSSTQLRPSQHRRVVSPVPVHQESHLRSLVKGLTWRIVATTTTTVIAWLVIGEVETALQIGFFEFFAKLAIYYAHERVWTYIRL